MNDNNINEKIFRYKKLKSSRKEQIQQLIDKKDNPSAAAYMSFIQKRSTFHENIKEPEQYTYLQVKRLKYEVNKKKKVML